MKIIKNNQLDKFHIQKKWIWKTISNIIASKHVREPDFESFLAIFTQHDPWKGPKIGQMGQGDK